MEITTSVLAVVFAGIALILAIYWKGDVKAALKVQGVELSLEAKEPTRTAAAPQRIDSPKEVSSATPVK